MVSDQQMYADTKQVMVPPVQQFLTMELKPDKQEYQPREEGIHRVPGDGTGRADKIVVIPGLPPVAEAR